MKAFFEVQKFSYELITVAWLRAGTKKAIAYDSIIFILNEHFFPVDGGITILEETTPTRIEMLFHYRPNVNRQNNIVLTCSSDFTL